MFRSLFVGILAAALTLAPVAQACTGIRLIAKDGGVVAARSLEFGLDLHSEVMVVPAGTTLTGTLPDGGKGISYKTKYGFVGADAEGMTAIVDGMNDQGLYVGLFYFPGYASYTDATKDNVARAMAPHEYANWLLGNFATVEEVKANFNKVMLVPVVVEAIEQVVPVHFVVHDRSGKSAVIEPLDKSLKIYDNPRGDQFADLRLAHDQSAQLCEPHRHQCSADRPRRHQARGIRPGLRSARLAGRLHAAVSFRARGGFFTIGAPLRYGSASRLADVPYPQQLRPPARGGSRGGQRPDACRGDDLDQRRRSEEPALVFQDL